MPVGLQFFAQDGSNYAQVDGQYQNLFMRRAGVATTTTRYYTISGGNISYVTVNIGTYSRRPMVAIRCGAPAMMSYPQQQGDGSWVVQFYIRSPEGSSLSWHAFDTLNPGDVNNYGCVVMREDGQVIFDAVGKSMRVVGTLSSSGSFGGSSLSLPNGRAYAVAFNAGAQIRQVGPSSSIILSNMVTVNDGSISMSGYQSANLGAAAAGTQTHPSYGIAIDVTNY